MIHIIIEPEWDQKMEHMLSVKSQSSRNGWKKFAQCFQRQGKKIERMNKVQNKWTKKKPGTSKQRSRIKTEWVWLKN